MGWAILWLFPRFSRPRLIWMAQYGVARERISERKCFSLSEQRASWWQRASDKISCCPLHSRLVRVYRSFVMMFNQLTRLLNDNKVWEQFRGSAFRYLNAVILTINKVISTRVILTQLSEHRCKRLQITFLSFALLCICRYLHHGWYCTFKAHIGQLKHNWNISISIESVVHEHVISHMYL